MCIFVAEQKQKEMKELTKEQLEIVKREHPEWFNDVEVGKWYNLNRGKCLVFVTELISHKEAIGYGFNYIGAWREDGNRWGIEGAIKATREEVKSALISEAKRRYKVGDRLSKIYEDYADCENRCFGERKFTFEGVNLYMQNDISEYSYCLFYNGQWASVIPQEKPSLKDDIKSLKDRWPNINFTIIAEEKK